MKIILIHKAKFEFRPPVISVVFNLLSLGHQVTIINAGVNEYWSKILLKQGVQIYTIDTDGKGVLNKIKRYYLFRKKVYAILKDNFPNRNEGILWIEGAYTLLALGNGIKRYQYVLQIQELHEHLKYQLKAIDKVIHQAKAVFMPEYNRTVLYQIWFKLEKRPYVLPNKPYFLPSLDNLKELAVKYSQWVDLFKDNKVILYQGHISSDRDLCSYVDAVKKLGADFKFVLLGHDHGMLKKYYKIDPTIIHIDFVPAPDYLLFTSLAYIGILSYSPVSENNIYCAPNKIFEYTAYGLPIVGNDIPGLFYPINMYHLGQVVDENDTDSICKAILHIDLHHDEYIKYTRLFFESVNNKETIFNVLNGIENDYET